MKKINIFCVMIVSLLIFCSTCVAASENSAIFIAGHEGIECTGTLVTVPLYLEENSGFTSVCLEVAFDDDKMELLSVDDFGLLPGANYSTDFSSPYYLRWENSDLDKDIKTEGLVCNLIFYVYEEATGIEFPIILGGLEPNARSAIRSDGSIFELGCVDGSIGITIPEHECDLRKWLNASSKVHDRSCDICGYTEYEDHKWSEIERKPATQEKEGYVIYECEVCKDDKTEILSILPPDAPEVDNPPQEDEEDPPVCPPSMNFPFNFKDIFAHWAEKIIKFITEHGLMDGITDTEFRPNSPMTRKMFITALARLADVQEDAISWAISNGLLSGYGNGNYGLNDTITREQMTVLITRYCDIMDIDLDSYQSVSSSFTFADDKYISSWAAPSVYKIHSVGLIKGKGNNLYDPRGTTTRAEAASVLYNLIQTVYD